jgi:hypothetical protein
VAKLTVVPPSTAKIMMELFAGWEGAHGTHGVPTRKPDSLKWEIRSTAETRKEKVTAKLWEDHLSGKKPLGIICIREDGMVRWGSIDYDVYDANLLELVERVRKAKLPLVPCRSKSGGLHLFMFTKEWVAASTMQSTLRDLAAQLGLAECEIFPKQTQVLVERGDLGSWMVMPYFGGTFDGKLQEQVGLKRNGAEMLVEEFVAAAEEQAVDEESLAKLARKRPRLRADLTGRGKAAQPGVEYPEPEHPFSDGPPCLETLAKNGVGSGIQNNTLLNMGTYYKKRYPDNWKEHLEEAARTLLTPPGRADGTVSVIKSLEKKDYFFTCKVTPLCDHCNSGLCRTRPFGVGEEGDYPVLMNIRYMKSDPPIFFVSFDGDRTVEVSTDELFTYSSFQRASMAQGQRLFMPMKQADWTVALKSALENATPVDDLDDRALEEIGEKGRLIELLEEFLTNRYRGDSPESLLNGRPYLDDEEKMYYFRLTDFDKHVQREGMKNITRGKLVQRIQEKGGKAQFKNIGGRGVRTWKIPEDRVETKPQLTLHRGRKDPGI